MKPETLIIQEYEPVHQPSFERLYRDWFTAHFHAAPEPKDNFVLQQPEKAILEHGGAILVAMQEDRLAGTVALKKMDSTTFELTKMAVAEEFRGNGLGKELVRAVIGKATSLGARRIILYSHKSLETALHVYRKFGFIEVPLEPGTYSHFRCNIKMELWLDEPA